MPRSYHSGRRNPPTYFQVIKPAQRLLGAAPPLKSRGNKPLGVSFEEQFYSLIYFHLENHESGREHLQALDEDDFARKHIAPEKGMKRSTFFEMNNSRGLEQMSYMFQELQKKASGVVLPQYTDLGALVAVDGSLLDAVLSMYWADYRKGSKKAKVHLGFNLNQGIPQEIQLSHGKKGERPFVEQILSPGQTGVLDRGYQSHSHFDQWQEEGRHFVCRIRTKTKKTVIKEHDIPTGNIAFYDALVFLGTPDINQTEKPLRVVGYTVEGIDYWVATDRFDLSPEKIAFIYKLRWDIEKFFKWWKRHLKVYHILLRTKQGLFIQLLAGLITYLLLAIYCQEQYGERVTIKRVREIRSKIRNEELEIGGHSNIFSQYSGP